MFPRSSIRRLRFAFTALAGLTLLALLVGCIAFVYNHKAQTTFVEESVPLLVNIEHLSKEAVGISSTSREMEAVDSKRRFARTMARYLAQSDALQAALLKLADYDPQARMVEDLNRVVQELEAHEEAYASALGEKIDATTELAVLRREIGQEGQKLKERLSPLALEPSMKMIDLTRPSNNGGPAEPELLDRTISEIQLLTGISFATERFLQATGGPGTDHSAPLAGALREALAPEFRRLTQLVFKLDDEDSRKTIAQSLQLFDEKALQSGGVADQSEQLRDAIQRLEILGRQRSSLMTRMSGLVDEIVVDARSRFFSGAETTRRNSVRAVTALVVFSVIALAAAVWIGWRLIDRDIARRLDRLATSTIALADGDLDVAIDQSGSDELSGMARATEIFRRNAQALRQAEAQLADRLQEVEVANQGLADVNEALDRANVNLADSELRYKLAIAGSSAGIWDWDATTGALFWSDRLKRLLGATDETFEGDFSSFIDRVHPDDRNLVLECRRLHLEAGPGHDYDVECRIRRDDGAYKWVHNRGQAVWDERGQPLRMAGSVHDITDRKLAEIKLTRYAEELERSNRELDDFAYIASHDLKEPLRAFYNHASFLLEDYEGKLDEGGEKRLHRMIKLSKRMEQLIDDLLYISRLGRGDQTVENLDITKVITRIETSLAETLTSRNARIVISGKLPSISGHHAHLTTLFQNLISNAVKYNDAEEKIVEIGLAPQSANDNAPSHATLYVRDNGIGIENCFRDDIFRIFKRLNKESKYGEGTGAGLTFVKKIVENHGGEIWLESEPGAGTTFFLTLKKAS